LVWVVGVVARMSVGMSVGGYESGSCG